MKMTSKKSHSTEFIQEHVLTGYTITPVLRYNLDKTEIGMNIKPISYTGDDSLQHFFASGQEYLHAMELLHEVECKKPIFIEKGSEEYESHYKDDTCHICEEEINCKISLKEFIKLKHEMKIEEDDYTLEKSMEIPMYDANWLKGPKVWDHCHVTGKYRGPAHSVCNQQLKGDKTVPIFFLNLIGYDSHIIFRDIAEIENIDDVQVIAKNLVKFISFSVKMSDCIFKLIFLDSFNFLCSSLSKLTDNLKNKTDILIKESDKIEVYHQYFKNTYNNFRVKHPELSINCFQLLLRKGNY
ncbi:uncharacterized protein LOC111716929 [Eurytemora carolleeae]|uniref:uncharacterized protein LOC111716929 n=1 Tax=Eurytemora carolleeae TaxID=1294199 RepID=UPI000C779F98|nr:uncharacterized protein LOC111716929 [Eurytemora carolleeae]|eukprot:XP_023348207.1 uncharacterized protein LOC111716929 [Eurytemora affinis]